MKGVNCELPALIKFYFSSDYDDAQQWQARWILMKALFTPNKHVMY